MVDTDRITGAAREAAGRVQSAVGDLVGSGRDSAEGRARQARGRGEALYGEAKDTVRNAADYVSDFAEDAYDNASDYARRGRRTVRRQVEEAPLAALLIAGAVGFGLALLLNSRN